MRDVINLCSDFENKNKLSYKVSIDSRRDWISLVFFIKLKHYKLVQGVNSVLEPPTVR